MTKRKRNIIISIISIVAVFIVVAVLSSSGSNGSNSSSNYNSCGGFQERALVYDMAYRVWLYNDINKTFYTEAIDKSIRNSKNNKQLRQNVKEAFPGIEYSESQFLADSNHPHTCSATLVQDGKDFYYNYRFKVFTNGSQEQVEVYDFSPSN